MANPHYDEGRYVCRIDEQALGKAGTGTPQFVLRFTVLGRVFGPGQTEPCENYQRTSYHAITPNTAERLAEDLKAIGYNRDSFKYLDPAVQNHHSFENQQVEMYCKHDTYQGEAKEKWQFAKRGSSKPLDVKPLDAAGIRQLDNLFGKHLKVKGGAPQPQSAPAREPQPQPIDPGDDVPFAPYEVPVL